MDYSNLKKNLRELAEKKRKAKEEEDKIRQAKNEEDRNTMLTAMSKDFGNVFKPYLEQIKEHSSLTSKELSRLIAESVQINVPGIDTSSLENAVKSSIAEAMGSLRFPTPQSTVNIPEIKIPPVNMPKEMDIKGWIGMMGYDKGLLQNPFPVQIRDANGKPVDLASIGGQTISGGGGKMDFFTVKGITNTIGVVTINPDGSPVYSGGSSGGGLTDTELRASAVPVAQVSGSSWSVNVVGSTQTAVSLLNSDGQTIDPRDRNWTIAETVPVSTTQSLEVKQVSGTTDSVNVVSTVGLTDTQLRASSVPVEQVSGSAWSVYVKEIFGSAVTSLFNGDNRIPVSVETGGSGLTDSELRATAVPVSQVSGAMWSTSVWDVFQTSVASNVINPDNRVKVELPSGSSGLTDTELRASALQVIQLSGTEFSTVVNSFLTSLETKQVSGTIDSVKVTGFDVSVAATIIDSSGVGYSGSNPIPAYLVAGSGNSTISVGPTLHDAADDGSAPQKIGGTAMTANPTAVSGGDIVRASFDKIGRQVIRSFQVRELTQTAYATLTNGTETTLLAGSASTFHDLVYVMGTNSSDAAVSVDIRSGTGGGIVATINIPPNSMAGFSPTVPVPQDVAAATWTADMSDITGTTVKLSALFLKEI